MYIENLKLNNFKNFSFFESDFSPINCIVGNNGVGKTNILDSVYYLSFCKDFRVGNDSYTIKHGEDFFSVFGSYITDSNTKELYSCSQKRGQKKRFLHNKTPYKKLSEHIGKVPCVILSPYDNLYISGQSEWRRRFVDMVLSQTDPVYMDNLINYNKNLEQKNKLLKLMLSRQYTDNIQLEIYNEALDRYAAPIQTKRREFFEDFLEYFQHLYKFISEKDEIPSVFYRTYEGKLSDVLACQTEKEKILGYTLSGVHRDDLVFMLNGYNVKDIGSQGQQKTFCLAMKLSQYYFLYEKTKERPILLLDDIFDKFDFVRVNKILELVSKDEFGQIFITDTHLDRLKNIIPSQKEQDATIITL